ncbi:isoprenylcysteine carboxylmethyltransferase family protein [Kribbella capetownensis]|uniref:Isoprenylcysteine carboxylmethyltransferase family protein n=1 Tax=Kribbella capetownensis TaxID=1572659 RepID=A0A4R0K4T1_9ACTN|nr:isoprenylcysteine carboxylmethyltransferase family protein [Kribbella capetownensis]
MPEASLAGIAAAAALEQAWPLPLPEDVRRVAGWPIVAAGVAVIAGSLKTAGTTELASPGRLVTGGPYARTRNPMYVGWGLLQLGIGVIAGSGWVLVSLPFVGALVHREVLREEQRLEERFGDEYLEYSEKVGRWLPRR